MVRTLGDDDLVQIRQRCEAATLGPWISSWEGRDHDSGESVILRGDQRQFEDLCIKPCTLADQDFIAHAREDLPALVDEVLRLRKLLNNKV